MYLHGMVRGVGEHLAAKMLSDLVVTGAIPTSVMKVGQWWVISSATDWIAGPDGVGMDEFAKIIPFGRNSHRAEILLRRSLTL